MNPKDILILVLLAQAGTGVYTIVNGTRAADEKLDLSRLISAILGWMALSYFVLYVTTWNTLELTVGKDVKEILSTVLLVTGLGAFIMSLLTKRVPIRALWVLAGIAMLIWPLVVIPLSRF